MKTQNTTLNARLAAGTRYGAVPVQAAPFRATGEIEFDRLKHLLLRVALDTAAKAELCAPLKRAANDAAAVAWLTSFPLLFFPALFEEKAATAQVQAVRQMKVRAWSQEAYATVA